MQPTLATLDNGLRLVLVPCEAESVAFGLFISSGSRHESDELAGISHFIEHMLFKGTERRSQLDITQAIEGRGGNFNAYTSEEGTAYFAHMPSEYMAEAIDIISDMYLNALIPDDEFMREREVVIEEIKMYQDEPDSVAAENLQRALFPRHSLGRPVAGSEKTLLAMTPKMMRAYIRSHYSPSSTVAVVVGAFEPEEATRLVKAALGGKRRSCRAAKAITAAADQSAQGSLDVEPIHETAAEKDVKQVQLALGYKTFGIRDSRKYAASVMDAVLGRGMSSRLFQQVREKRGLSYDISSRWQFFSDTGMFTISAGLDPAKADKALAVIDREIKRISTVKVPKAELERTKEFLVGNFRLSHEKILSKLLYYGATVLSFGRLVTTAEQVEGIRRVTAEEVLAVARETLLERARAVSRVVPINARGRS